MPTSLIRLCLLLSVLAEAAGAFAGVTYEVTVTRTADGGGRQTYTVVAEGAHILATQTGLLPDQPVTHDSVLWTGSAPAIALNSRNQTWYELTPDTSGTPTRLLDSAMPANPLAAFGLASRFLSPLSKGNIRKLTVQLNPPSIVGGDRHYTGRIAYDVHTSSRGIGMKVACSATFDVFTTGTVDRRHWLGQILPITGYPDVDAKISAAEASIEGFPVRLSMKATRAYEGGPPMADVVEVQVSGIGEVTPELKAFTRPANYRHQRPVIGVPGREGF